MVKRFSTYKKTQVPRPAKMQRLGMTLLVRGNMMQLVRGDHHRDGSYILSELTPNRKSTIDSVGGYI
jgi:hypothetical protein